MYSYLSSGWQRNFFHSLCGLIVLLLLNIEFPWEGNDRQIVFGSLCVLALLLILSEWVRLRVPPYNHWVRFFLGKMMKEKEKKREWVSAVSYLLGILIVMAMFSKTIVSLSVMNLAFGDVAASLVGKLYHGKKKEEISNETETETEIKTKTETKSKSKSKSKTWRGWNAFVVASVFSGSIYLAFLFLDAWSEFLSFFMAHSIGAGLAGVVEKYSNILFNGKFDDNILIPIFSALTITLVLLVFGYPLSDLMSIVFFIC